MRPVRCSVEKQVCVCASVCLTPASRPVCVGEGAQDSQPPPHELLNLMPYSCLTEQWKWVLLSQHMSLRSFRNYFWLASDFLTWLTYSCYLYLVIRNKYYMCTTHNQTEGFGISCRFLRQWTPSCGRLAGLWGKRQLILYNNNNWSITTLSYPSPSALLWGQGRGEAVLFGDLAVDLYIA